MHALRKQEVTGQILAHLAALNVGPGEYVPVRTLRFQAMNRHVSGNEFFETLDSMLTVEPVLLTHRPGGPPGGSVALTEEGYKRSRGL